MRFSPLYTLVLLTLTSWILFCHATPAMAPAPFEVISPEEGSEYYVGDRILAQVLVLDEELEDKSPIITLTLQRAIPKPDVNIHLNDVLLDNLSDDGYEFDILDEYQGDKRSNRYRIRFSFHDPEGRHHYVDSGVFKIYDDE
ncbi:hypothetical protein BGZ74_010738 [Mortierella antarctica]|nr:hypothetical protein BGZ74_010738 [Mortierella antarctica]